MTETPQPITTLPLAARASIVTSGSSIRAHRRANRNHHKHIAMTILPLAKHSLIPKGRDHGAATT